MSVSESSKAWISNSDRTATNQTAIVSLLQRKLVRLGYVARSASLALSSQGDYLVTELTTLWKGQTIKAAPDR